MNKAGTERVDNLLERVIKIQDTSTSSEAQRELYRIEIEAIKTEVLIRLLWEVDELRETVQEAHK
jgi:hypothetical protein